MGQKEHTRPRHRCTHACTHCLDQSTLRPRKKLRLFQCPPPSVGGRRSVGGLPRILEEQGFFFYFNKGNRSERYRLYFLFSPSTPPALQAVGERDLGSRHQGAHRSCSLLVLQLKTSRLQELTPRHGPPTPTAPYHAKVLWRTQKFLTALFEAKLPTVALRRWSV